MINLRKHDPIADAVKDILQQEALKGNQHLIDKNKNNEVDAHDFKVLRGEKKPAASNAYTQTSGYPSFKKKPAAVKEEETVEEGMSHQAATTMKHIPNPSPALKKAAKDIKPGIAGYRDRIDMLKAGGVKEETESVEEGLKDMAKKAFKVVTGGSDEDQRKNLQKKMGVPQTGKKPVNEGGIGDLPNRGMGGSDTKGSFGVYRNSGSGDTKLKIVSKHKTLDSALKHVDKLRKKSGKDDHFYGHLSSHQPDQGKIPKHFHEEVQGKTLKQFMENAFDYKTPRKPEPNGGSGVKQGSAYGGSKQKDKPEQATEKK